ncbi:class I SAM-dependent methyltransferase [Paenibacillus senegalensis]|uniref:class I SAM-dependent methyltransferase n=1 Tax=Paenibacillus senegalensis TaxID=1465766 RepID=UPI000287CA1F|nr:class I SAM-dependent methyltransferase [Paenibacillus senegalensis]
MSKYEQSRGNHVQQSNGYHQIGFAMTCRSWEEYIRMFALQESDLSSASLVDVAAGAASFTASALERGIDATAVDPLYALDQQSVLQHAREELAQSGAKIAALKQRMDWSYYGSYERYQERREQSLAKFTASFTDPVQKDRYIAAGLPTLPLQDDRFSLVLCSHLLFLYEQELDAAFHMASILELLRICRPGGQIRIYPLFNLAYQPYSKMEQLLTELSGTGAQISWKNTRLPFIPGSKQLLCITKALEK